MNGAKIQPEKGKVKYFYDYPENRGVSKHLTTEDKLLIAFHTGFSIRYVRQWCRGERRSRRIEEMARRISSINIAKWKKIYNIYKTSSETPKP